MKHLMNFLFLFILGFYASGQQNNFVKIKGYAPSYIGPTVQLNEIEDYFSMMESTIASPTVQEDSTFSLIFKAEDTQKVLISIGNNTSSMYIQSGGNYTIYLPEKDKYNPYRPSEIVLKSHFMIWILPI